MSKNTKRLIYSLIFFAILWVFMKISEFELSVILGLAWLNADNAVDNK